MNIEPMLAQLGDVPLSSLAGTHVFDTKLDGVRMLLHWDGTMLRLVNRHGRVCTESWPELQVAPVRTGIPMVLDGEVIAGQGFQDAARRDKVTKARLAEAMAAQMPATFVAFDLLWLDDLDLRDVPYQTRRARLDLLADQWLSPHYKPSFTSEDPGIYAAIAKAGGEGVIAKRKTARYTAGRSRNWLKYKVTHSVTCVGVGYDPGSGSRAEFGAMRLAMVDAEGGVHLVGRVGSGFRERDVREMKALFDNARSGEDLPVVEVECLGLTRDGVLRQPVFKGVRSDQTMHDATITQLEGLPRS